MIQVSLLAQQFRCKTPLARDDSSQWDITQVALMALCTM